MAKTEVLAAEGLSKRYATVEALRDVTFAIEGPQVVGVLGPNGAGKTTLLEIFEGLSAPTAGRARLLGEDLVRAKYPRRRVGVVLQREFALDRITVREYAELFAAIYGVPGGRERIIEAAELGKRARTPVERLSGGESQRLFIAAASVHDPEILFLDEPTAQLDPEKKGEIGALIREMGTRRTVVITTHDLAEADAVCDHVLFLVGGAVKAQGSRAALIDSVPVEKRHGRGIEDAFFHFCTGRLTARGDYEEGRIS